MKQGTEELGEIETLTLQERYLGSKPVPVIPARQQDLASYDHLLPGNWHRTEAVSHA